MIAIIYLSLALCLGYSFTRWLQLRLAGIETAAISIITGLFGFTWIILLPCLILPYRFALPVGSLAISALIVWLLIKGKPAPRLKLDRKIALTWSVIAVASLIFWAWLMITHDLLPTSNGLMSAGSTWADFGLHASIVSHQALPSSLPHDLPIASGTPLTYPFLIDFLSALFVRGGWSMNFALAVPGILLAWSITQLLIAFGWRLWGRFGGAVLGTILILTCGSAAGGLVALGDWRASGLTLLAWLHHIPQNYSGIDAINVHVNNAVADLLLPQRAFLFGLGIWLVTAILWHSALAHHRRRWLFAAALMVGLLPLAHPHSFVAACTLLAGLLVWVALHQRAHLSVWLQSLALLVAVALPQLAWQQLAIGSGTGGHIVEGWTRLAGESLIGFEWHNFGLILVVLIGLAVLLMKPRWRRYSPWLVPFFILFVFAHVYSLQPFAYDNLKLIFYVLIMAMLALGGLVWRSGQITRWVLAAVCLVVFSVPGTLTIVREFQLHDQFASNDDIALANWAKQNTSPDSIFATTDSPNQPLATLAGRSIVLGYRGWLYNYHLDYVGRQDAVSALLVGNTSDPNVAAYHPNFLAVRVVEPSDWTVNTPALANLNLVFSNATWSVYALNP
ncbi:hypothetical protein HJC99_02470 [Candidatus Saccharibacteria bacterium]|nr:hypothetical protein [Candidatus Saccharibacteria bacterium]